MANVICDMENCKYRSKRRMRNYIKKNGEYCYKCTLQVKQMNCLIKSFYVEKVIKS